MSPDNDQDEVEILEELNTTNKELVEIDDSEDLIGSNLYFFLFTLVMSLLIFLNLV